MELDPEELRSLACFIARRMGPEVVLDPTDPPPAGDRADVWTTLLEEARDEGRLDDLIRRVAAHDPADAALQEACRLLVGDRPPVRPVRVPRAAVAVALAAFLTVGVLVGPRLVADPPEPEPVRVELALQPQSIGTEALAAVGYVEPTEALAAVGYVEPTEALAAVGYVEPRRTEAGPSAPVASGALAAVGSSEPAAGSDATTGDCGARPGELVGYWYAGERPPGGAGEVVVLPHAVNVRAAYPEPANRFDARTPVRCVLGAGARVRLSADPIPVPRDSWWVPLISGDVLHDRTS